MTVLLFLTRTIKVRRHANAGLLSARAGPDWAAVQLVVVGTGRHANREPS